jgi:hypothetical protein
LPEPMMLLRGRASQSLETAAAWLFCGTEILAAPPPAERVQLGRKDGATLRPEVAPRTRRDAIKQWQGTSRSQCIGLLERLFESESHSVVEFVVQGTDRHKTFMLRTSCHGLDLHRMPSHGAPLLRGSAGAPADVWFAQNVKIVPNSLRHECA